MKKTVVILVIAAIILLGAGGAVVWYYLQLDPACGWSFRAGGGGVLRAGRLFHNRRPSH